MATISNHTHTYMAGTHTTQRHVHPLQAVMYNSLEKGDGENLCSVVRDTSALIGLKYRRRVVRCGMVLQHARNGTGNGMEPELKCNQEWMRVDEDDEW